MVHLENLFVQGTGLQQMLHSTSCHRPFYFNPRQMYALCVCVLDAFAVSTQLIANSANVQTNWEFGISGFGNVIMSLRSGTTHDCDVDCAALHHFCCCCAAHHNVQQGTYLLH